LAGRCMTFTATSLPRQVPRYTEANEPEPSR
jgi:hypothetical protein